MSYIHDIARYAPRNNQETANQAAMLRFIKANPSDVLLRENAIAHITSSGFIMNPNFTRALMVHHNIRDTWAWTGGHADGDADLLAVALREAREETGITSVRPHKEMIASLDILCSNAHVRRGEFVGTHLHLSVAYLLIADEGDALTPQAGENTAVKWFGVSEFTRECFSEADLYLYRKLMKRYHQGGTI